ncbi:amino acid/polyamine transporter I [Xylogone sp. PMI_703]|nr:amino acid/polyamine transporter I [Xylogone sp. PMI_703]
METDKSIEMITMEERGTSKEERLETDVVAQQQIGSDPPSEKGALERFINPAAIVNFGFTLQAAWEAAGTSFQFSLLNGGPASLVYGSIISGVGSTAIAISLAEMASMDPVVGAQYRWSAAFAPIYPEFWGLFQGWMTIFAWITVTAASPAYLSNIVIGLAIFNYPDYEPERWHGTLIMWGFVILPVVWNFWFRKMLNTLEMIGGICHVVFFIISIITLVLLAHRSDSSYVFGTLTHDLSGWTNPGVAFNLGLLTVTFPITSFDGVLHMSDEVNGPRTRVPHSMISAVTLNSIMQWAYMVAVLFCIGDIEAVTNTPTGLPIIEVYWEATKSVAATNILVVMMAFILFISLFNIFASVSRLTWAFSRDKGLPFSKTFAYVHPGFKIPINALGLVGVICCLLAIINIPSATAFNALISLPTIALYISYFIPIFFILLRKLQNRHPVYGPFKLGHWGIPINLFSLVYIIYIIIFLPFPTVLPVDASTINYAGPLVGAVILIAIGDWFISGKRRFKVPKSAMSLN